MSDAPPAPGPAQGTPAEAPPLPRRGVERLDLLLLAAEALDLHGGEALLVLSEQMGFGALFPNRVELWKRRCHNPLRRATRRGTLATGDTDALIRLLCAMAERLYPMLRALLSTAEPADLTAQRWQLFHERLTDLVRERMNPRRSGVQRLLEPAAAEAIGRPLVRSLALAAGTGGFERVRASLMDAAA
ncbi:MAG: DUF3038 domain-containing protein [Prochlorococcaceae cyanobacterium]